MKHIVKVIGLFRYELASIALFSVALITNLTVSILDTAPPAIQEVVQAAPPPKDENPSTKIPIQTNKLFASEPTWIQDFSNKEGSVLDSRYWSAIIGPAENSNREQQYYTDDLANLRFENGALRLIATLQNQPGGYRYGSARLETIGKQTFLYGRIDITVKLPSGVGTWPAVWLLPANNLYADLSPSSDQLRYKNGGEIDIVEAVGFLPNDVYGVAHTRATNVDGSGSHGVINVENNDTVFNTYTLLWTPTELTFEVNGVPYHTYRRQNNATYMTWPFDQPFYLIANLALGGTWGGMDVEHFPGNGIDDSALPASLDIRSIYYYPYIGE